MEDNAYGAQILHLLQNQILKRPRRPAKKNDAGKPVVGVRDARRKSSTEAVTNDKDALWIDTGAVAQIDDRRQRIVNRFFLNSEAARPGSFFLLISYL
ncbi:MAG TPA: hypothetical protein V6D17_03380 [Candidatus Obscuribacterales bacterium]